MDKSKVSFSRNIELARKNMLKTKLSFKAVEKIDKYLRLPTYIESSKKRVFQIIQDRVWKKLKVEREVIILCRKRDFDKVNSGSNSNLRYAMLCNS